MLESVEYRIREVESVFTMADECLPDSAQLEH